MARRPFDAKPLSEQMLTYCQLHPWEYMSVKFKSKIEHFNHENALKISSGKRQLFGLGVNVLSVEYFGEIWVYLSYCYFATLRSDGKSFTVDLFYIVNTKAFLVLPTQVARTSATTVLFRLARDIPASPSNQWFRANALEFRLSCTNPSRCGPCQVLAENLCI